MKKTLLTLSIAAIASSASAQINYASAASGDVLYTRSEITSVLSDTDVNRSRNVARIGDTIYHFVGTSANPNFNDYIIEYDVIGDSVSNLANNGGTASIDDDDTQNADVRWSGSGYTANSAVIFDFQATTGTAAHGFATSDGTYTLIVDSTDLEGLEEADLISGDDLAILRGSAFGGDETLRIFNASTGAISAPLYTDGNGDANTSELSIVENGAQFDAYILSVGTTDFITEVTDITGTPGSGTDVTPAAWSGADIVSFTALDTGVFAIVDDSGANPVLRIWDGSTDHTFTEDEIATAAGLGSGEFVINTFGNAVSVYEVSATEVILYLPNEDAFGSGSNEPALVALTFTGVASVDSWELYSK